MVLLLYNWSHNILSNRSQKLHLPQHNLSSYLFYIQLDYNSHTLDQCFPNFLSVAEPLSNFSYPKEPSKQRQLLVHRNHHSMANHRKKIPTIFWEMFWIFCSLSKLLCIYSMKSHKTPMMLSITLTGKHCLRPGMPFNVESMPVILSRQCPMDAACPVQQ